MSEETVSRRFYRNSSLIQSSMLSSSYFEDKVEWKMRFYLPGISDSRNWIPRKLKILPSKKDDTPDDPPLILNKLRVLATETGGSSQVKNVSGNYDPQRGYVFRALNMIENEVFYSHPVSGVRQNGIIQNALVYLNYDIYE